METYKEFHDRMAALSRARSLAFAEKWRRRTSDPHYQMVADMAALGAGRPVKPKLTAHNQVPKLKRFWGRGGTSIRMTRPKRGRAK